MSDQWTRSDPGAGSADSLSALSAKFDGLAREVDSSRDGIARAQTVFDSAWVGVSATAAQGALARLTARTEGYVDALETTRKAIDAYVEELVDIQKRAKEYILLRTSAQQRMQDELVQNPRTPEGGSAARNDLDEAIGALGRLADRRQDADESLLAVMRAEIALNWDVPPEDYPSDRSWLQGGHYEYDMDHDLGFSTDDYTAEELMEYFKKYPTEVFPFPVSGSSDTFEDGAVFTLSDTIVPGVDLPFEEGEVVVTTTPTSVKFTVISDDYFDGPGSTIEFSIVEKGGQFYLRKIARAVDAEYAVQAGVGVGAGATWEEQARNLAAIVEKYRGK